VQRHRRLKVLQRAQVPLAPARQTLTTQAPPMSLLQVQTALRVQAAKAAVADRADLKPVKVADADRVDLKPVRAAVVVFRTSPVRALGVPAVSHVVTATVASTSQVTVACPVSHVAMAGSTSRAMVAFRASRAVMEAEAASRASHAVVRAAKSRLTRA
jgi:hypothetical protein